MRETYKILTITLLWLFIFSLPLFADVQYPDHEQQIHDELLKRGWTNSYAAIGDKETLIRFEVNIIDANVIDYLADAAAMAHIIHPSDIVKAEAYYQNKPLLALTARGTALQDFLDGRISRQDLNESLAFKDLRNMEEKLINDLSIFDVFIEKVQLSKDTVAVELDYRFSDERTFWQDLLSMSVAVVSDIPWSKEIQFKYITESPFSINIPSVKVLSYLEGSITPAEFAAEIQLNHSSVVSEDQEAKAEKGKKETGSPVLIGTVILLLLAAAGLGVYRKFGAKLKTPKA